MNASVSVDGYAYAYGTAQARGMEVSGFDHPDDVLNAYNDIHG